VLVRRLGGHIVAEMSPTVHTEDGFQFWFWSNEGHEPPHIHVFKGGANAKWRLDPLRPESNHGFNPSQLARIRDILNERRDEMLERWNETFSKKTDE
jgi:hypothetical protein